MKRIVFLIILAISWVCFAFAATAGRENPDSDTLDLILEAKLFMGTTGEETASNIEKFITEAKKIRGLSDAYIANIIDNNLHASLTVKKKDYKKSLDKLGIEQLKKELESDPLVSQIWVWYNEIYIKFKRKLYTDDIKIFVARHADLPGVTAAYDELKDVTVSLGGIAKGRAQQCKELIKNKFPEKIK